MEVDDRPECGTDLDGERRDLPRCMVDEEATLLLVGHGGGVKCRIVELSLEGCRIRAGERLPMGVGHRVETSFKLCGVAFRFVGVAEWSDGLNLAGIKFLEMPARRREMLADVLCEVEAKKAVKPEQVATEKPPVAEPARVRNELKLTAEPQLANGFPSAAAMNTPEPMPAALEPVSQPHSETGPPLKRERRQQSRHEVDTSAVIQLINVSSRLPGRIVDLSLSGCRIRTDERFPVGIYTRVETEFGLAGQTFRLGGVIQSVHDRDRRNVGIRFLDMSARKLEQVEQLIEEIEELRSRPTQPAMAEPNQKSHGRESSQP